MQHNSWRLNLAIIWVSQFFSMMAFNSTYSFIPFYFEHIGVQDEELLSYYVGMFAAAGNLSFAVFAPIWGVAADIYGRKIMLLRANFGAGILIPLMALITNPGLLIFHRFVLGALSGTVVAAQTLVLSTTPREQRPFALGAMASALFGGMMMGQFMGGSFVAACGYTWTFVVSGTLLCLSGFLVLAGVNEGFERTLSLKTWLHQFHFRIPRFGKVWYLLFLFFFMALARDLDGPFVPILLKKIMNNSPDALPWSGWLGGICSLAGILSGFLLGRFAVRFSIYSVLFAAVLISGLWRIPQALATTLGMLIVTRFCMVFAAGGIEPLLQSWLAGATSEKEHGTFFGWAACFKALGWTVGALCGGIIAHRVSNIRVVFLVGAALFLLLLPLISLIARRVPPRKEQGASRA